MKLVDKEERKPNEIIGVKNARMVYGYLIHVCNREINNTNTVFEVFQQRKNKQQQLQRAYSSISFREKRLRFVVTRNDYRGYLSDPAEPLQYSPDR